MRKIFAMLLMAVAVIVNIHAAEDWNAYKACATAEEFTAYGEREGVFIGRKWLCNIYADSLVNPQDYTKFTDYVTAFNDVAGSGSASASYVLFGATVNAEPMTKLYALRDEAYDYAKTNNLQFTYFFYLDNDFCLENEITILNRFNGLVNVAVKHQLPHGTMSQILLTLARLKFDVDDNVVLAGYKKLYRRYYPIWQFDPNYTTVVANIKATLDTYK